MRGKKAPVAAALAAAAAAAAAVKAAAAAVVARVKRMEAFWPLCSLFMS